MLNAVRINGLSAASIDAAARDLRKYALWVERKERELVTRLAERGKTVAEVKFASAIYDGTNDVSVRVDNTGSVAVIYAEGKAVAFIEFGSGASMGYGHPTAGEHGFGPGTWSAGEGGKGHWDDPHGWYYKHGEKSHGNPPAMAMYTAAQTMVAELTSIAREVFGTA
jgi:hypothetical protein